MELTSQGEMGANSVTATKDDGFKLNFWYKNLKVFKMLKITVFSEVQAELNQPFSFFL